MRSANFPDGVDDRWPVPNTTDFPWSANGYLSVETEASVSWCSGAMVGPFHFLTAAHCMAAGGFNPAYQSATVAPGRNGAVRPFGEANVVKTRTLQPAYNNDWALLTLDRQIGNFSNSFDFGSPSFTDFLTMPVQTAGYPEDLPLHAPGSDNIGETMYETTGISPRVWAKRSRRIRS
jgi:V8-like Glu-specific endopeptidase